MLKLNFDIWDKQIITITRRVCVNNVYNKLYMDKISV